MTDDRTDRPSQLDRFKDSAREAGEAQAGGKAGLTRRRALVWFVIIVFASAALLMPDAIYEGWRARTNQF